MPEIMTISITVLSRQKRENFFHGGFGGGPKRGGEGGLIQPSQLSQMNYIYIQIKVLTYGMDLSAGFPIIVQTVFSGMTWLENSRL